MPNDCFHSEASKPQKIILSNLLTILDAIHVDVYDLSLPNAYMTAYVIVNSPNVCWNKGKREKYIDSMDQVINIFKVEAGYEHNLYPMTHTMGFPMKETTVWALLPSAMHEMQCVGANLPHSPCW